MELQNCKQCGKPVGLRGYKTSSGGWRGVVHYLEHIGGGAMHETGWSSVSLKPYPVKEQDKPWYKLCERWNAANSNEQKVAQ